MMFKKFTTINGREIWLNIDKVEVIQNYYSAPQPKNGEKENHSIIYIHTDGKEKAYIVKGEADDIVNSIYILKEEWTGNGT